MIKIIFLLGISFLIYNCTDSPTNETDLDKKFNVQEIDEGIEVQVGDSVIISDIGLIITFKSVHGDSRCPADVICVWEGNAEIALGLKNIDGDTLSINLNTSLEPREVSFSNLTITIKKLLPYPMSNVLINPDDYVVTLMITNNEG
jgi:hypothetical protein